MSKFWVVALETFKRNVKSPTFLMMLLSPLLLIAITVGSGYIGSKMNQTGDVAIISNNDNIRQSVLAQVDLEINQKITTQDEATKALKAEEIDGILRVDFDEKESKVTASYQGLNALGTTDKLKLTQLLSMLQMNLTGQELNLTSEEVQKLLTPAELSEQVVEIKDNQIVDKTDDNKDLKTMLSMIVSIAMFMIITLYAQIVAQEVASEKGTRIMEIILSSTSAATHFYGKMMGIFMVILTQIAAYAVIFLGALPFVKQIDMIQDILKSVDLSGLGFSTFVYYLLYLLLGVMLYTIAAAFCGSLVSKSEDASKAVVPVTYLSMAGYFLTIFLGMNSPNNPIFKICSFIPFISSYTMPQRMAIGQVSTVEIIISLALLALAVFLLLKLSARLYKSTALVYSDESMFKVFKRSLTNETSVK